MGDYLFGYAAPGEGLARDVGSGRPRPSRRRWLASSNCVALGAPAVRSPQPSTHKGTSPDRVRTVSHSASDVRRRTRRSGNKADPGALYDPEPFRREILPKLAGVKLSEIVEAAGLLEGVRIGHQAWEVDAACSDVGGIGRVARRRGSASGQRGGYRFYPVARGAPRSL